MNRLFTDEPFERLLFSEYDFLKVQSRANLFQTKTQKLNDTSLEYY